MAPPGGENLKILGSNDKFYPLCNSAYHQIGTIIFSKNDLKNFQV